MLYRRQISSSMDCHTPHASPHRRRCMHGAGSCKMPSRRRPRLAWQPNLTACDSCRLQPHAHACSPHHSLTREKSARSAFALCTPAPLGSARSSGPACWAHPPVTASDGLHARTKQSCHIRMRKGRRRSERKGVHDGWYSGCTTAPRHCTAHCKRSCCFQSVHAHRLWQQACGAQDDHDDGACHLGGSRAWEPAHAHT